MKNFFIADLHLGHANILKYAAEFRPCRNIDEHTDWLVNQWNSVVGKRDRVFVLGDVAFHMNELKHFDRMAGQKFLIRGNHDEAGTNVYLQYFQEVYGLKKYKKTWLSHAPVHPDSLRGLLNIHGHTHQNSVWGVDGKRDERYFCVSVEQLNGVPISFDEIMMKTGRI